MNIEELKLRWEQEQRELARTLVFSDHDLSFTIGAGEDDATKLGGSDHIAPVVHHENQAGIDIKGLRFIGGLDISYVDSEAEAVKSASEAEPTDRKRVDAYATVVILSFPELKVLHEVTQPVYMNTPYIPSFLSYREAPTYIALLDGLREELKADGKEEEFPQLLIVDGNGRLHVREAGSACAVGVRSGIPTIGVAKNYHPPHGGAPANTQSGEDWRYSQSGLRSVAQSILNTPGDWFGLFRQAEDSPVADEKTYIGAALLPPGGAKNPIFVSPGHKVSLLTAIRITLALCKSRIPEATRQADLISREAVRKAARL